MRKEIVLVCVLTLCAAVGAVAIRTEVKSALVANRRLDTLTWLSPQDAREVCVGIYDMGAGRGLPNPFLTECPIVETGI